MPCRDEKKTKTVYSHSLCAITTVVHCSRHSYDERRNTVAHQVEVATAWVFTLKDLYQHDIELHALQEHPREGRQEKEMEQGREDGTSNLRKMKNIEI